MKLDQAAYEAAIAQRNHYRDMVEVLQQAVTKRDWTIARLMDQQRNPRLRTYEVTVRNKVNKNRWTFLVLREDFADVVRTTDLQEDEEVISITLDYE